jgi:3',5'-cyclic AMP phosphodiesterase CpdA
MDQTKRGTCVIVVLVDMKSSETVINGQVDCNRQMARKTYSFLTTTSDRAHKMESPLSLARCRFTQFAIGHLRIFISFSRTSLALTILLCCCLLKTDDGFAQGGLESSSSRPSRITFVQITDPHLFDAGWGRHGEGIQEEALDNRAAFDWSILETNRLLLSEARPIDFVVITGDFGLENLQLPANGNIPANKCQCPKRALHEEGPAAPMSLDDAAEEVARGLSALLVKEVLLVPGNNDLCDENPHDLHRWAEFVFALRKALQQQQHLHSVALQSSYPQDKLRASPPAVPQIVDLTYSLERLYRDRDPRILALYVGTKGPGDVPSDALSINGISLVGLDSAYFKPHADAKLQQVSSDASSKEMEFVRQLIKPGGSYLIFTHIPDITDPYRGSTGADRGSSWKLPSITRKLWHDEILKRSEVIAVFSGHFHSANQAIYPHNFDYANPKPDELAANKIWVAPPLAAKYQVSQPLGQTARGALFVSITGNGASRVSPDDGEQVKSSPIWFTTLDQKAATDGDDKLTQARSEEREGHWDEATKWYVAALGASNPRVRASASQGYARVRLASDSWWWGVGKYFPPIRWLFMAPYRFAEGFGVVLLVILIRWRRKRVFILKPDELTTGAPGAWFGREMVNAEAELVRRLEREGLAHQAGGRYRGTFLLTAPSSAFDSVISSVVAVQGVDVKGLVAFLLALWRYFGWRAESGLAVSGNTVSGLTSRRWGWLSRGCWSESAEVASAGTPNTDLTKALTQVARRLALRIVGVSFSENL